MRAATTIVFDLDGTLIDTAPDLIAATNHTLASVGRPPAGMDLLRNAVSHGALAMIRAGIGPDADAWEEERLYPLLPTFLTHYEANIAATSRPFDGLLDTLDTLDDAGYRLAVCTNKQERHAVRLLEALGLADRFAAIAGRDTFPVYKPDPGHLTSTVDKAGGDPRRAVMVGDSGTDVATAKNAGLPVVAVSFGYSDPPVATFGPDAL
ncbi:MAG: HAD-IA family hydrolase, partial [Hyphomicrobiaceae bacterium]|nr:HAD-IA family hydrolase [Hyphomicrobiaceae bacterium]